MLKWKNTTSEEPGEIERPQIISIEKPSMDEIPTGNKIYFYSHISKDTMLGLSKQIDELSKQIKIVQVIYDLVQPPRIELHISSEGGDVFAAMAVIDKIMDSKIPIDTYCEGAVASAGTLLSIAGHKRYISKNSCMLIHHVSSGLWGNYEDFKDEMKNLDLITDMIKNVYLKKTKFKAKQLDKLLAHDLYLSAEECLKYGLVDEIK